MTSVLLDSIIYLQKDVQIVAVSAMIRSVMHSLDSVSVLPTPLVAPVINVITHSGHGMRLVDVRLVIAVPLDPPIYNVILPLEIAAANLVYREESARNV